MGKRKFEVRIYRYPEIHRIEAISKEEAVDKVMNNTEFENIEVVEVDSINKDLDACINHFDWDNECKNCIQKLKERIEWNVPAETPPLSEATQNNG